MVHLSQSIYRWCCIDSFLHYFISCIFSTVEGVSATGLDLIFLGDLNYNYAVDETIGKSYTLYGAAVLHDAINNQTYACDYVYIHHARPYSHHGS